MDPPDPAREQERARERDGAPGGGGIAQGRDRDYSRGGGGGQSPPRGGGPSPPRPPRPPRPSRTRRARAGDAPQEPLLARAQATVERLEANNPRAVERYQVEKRSEYTASDSEEAAQNQQRARRGRGGRKARTRNFRVPVGGGVEDLPAADRPETVALPATLDGETLDTGLTAMLAAIFDDTEPWKNVHPLAHELFRVRMEEHAAGVDAGQRPAPSAQHPELFRVVDAMMQTRPAVEASWGRVQSEMMMAQVIEHVPRAHDDRALYAPSGSERECSMGEKCLNLKWHGWIMKEFLTPRRERARAAAHVIDPAPRQCLVCLRNATLLFYSRNVGNNIEPPQDVVAQTHANYVNMPGEYEMDDCVPTNTGTNDGCHYPIVMNKQRGYVNMLNAPVPHLLQKGYKICEAPPPTRKDFCPGAPRQPAAAAADVPLPMLPAPPARPASQPRLAYPSTGTRTSSNPHGGSAIHC